jgi:hypothetical protein
LFNPCRIIRPNDYHIDSVMTSSQLTCVFLDNSKRVLPNPVTVGCLNCGQLITTNTFPIYALCGDTIGAPIEFSCVHRGSVVDVQTCPACGGAERPVVIFSCRKHGRCSVHSSGGIRGVKTCIACPDRQEKPDIIPGELMVGCTTIPRGQPYLERTLISIESADLFPYLFHDRDGNAVVNWKMALGSLTMHDSAYVLLIQDDVVFCRNLRNYISALKWPEDAGCISLYTPDIIPDMSPGLHAAGGTTWGACALLFRTKTAIELLKTRTVATWPIDRRIDVMVGQAVRELGLRFYYHRPSLAQHIGEVSSFRDGRLYSFNRQAPDFVGETFDAMSLLDGSPPMPLSPAAES